MRATRYGPNEITYPTRLLIIYVQVLSIKDADFSWEKDAVQPTLEGINLVVRKGELLGVLGRVGAGKVCLRFL